MSLRCNGGKSSFCSSLFLLVGGAWLEGANVSSLVARSPQSSSSSTDFACVRVSRRFLQHLRCFMGIGVMKNDVDKAAPGR